MPWHRIGRFALWGFAIVLASTGGAIIHASVAEPDYRSAGPIGTFFGLVCVLSAAAIYVRRLR